MIVTYVYLHLLSGPLQLHLRVGSGLGQLYPLVFRGLNLLLELRKLAAVNLGKEVTRRTRVADFVVAAAIFLLKAKIMCLFQPQTHGHVLLRVLGPGPQSVNSVFSSSHVFDRKDGRISRPRPIVAIREIRATLWSNK